MHVGRCWSRDDALKMYVCVCVVYMLYEIQIYINGIAYIIYHFFIS